MSNNKAPILLNVTYIRPDKRRDIQESFEYIYKKHDGTVHKATTPAEVDIYFVKPEFRDYDYNKPQERIERLEKRRVLYSQIRYEIAKEIGEDGLRFVKQCYDNRDIKSLDNLYKWKFAFACDFQPEHYFMKQWYEKYGDPPTVKLSKGFLDIEIDQIDTMVDMDNISGSANCPVNCITVILEESKESYTFILRPYHPPKVGYTEEEYNARFNMYEKQLKDHERLMANMGEFIDDLHRSFDETYGYLDYHIREYESEVELIADVFRFINNRKPNYCLQWNMRFDIQYLIHRLIALGYNPADVICHPDFENKRCYFKVDSSPGASRYMIEKQFDYFYCSSYTQFICQMRLYASIRKSQHQLKSVSLNDIGDRELRDKKVEYPDATNMREFPYRDWLLFIKYNIKDVLITVGIERKTNDVQYYYNKSYSNITPYTKIFRETHLLRNVREKYFNKKGWVQGNNINIIGSDEQDDVFDSIEDDNGEEKAKGSSFKGAINADPIWNDNVGARILGSLSNIVYNNCMDFDMGAFYPSIKIFSNMDPMTLLYKAIFINEEFITGERRNRSLNTVYVERDKNNDLRNIDITGEAINTYISGNILTFGYNWLGLPDVTEMYNLVKAKTTAVA